MYKIVPALVMVLLTLAACNDSPTGVPSEIEPSVSAASANTPSVAGRFIVTLRERVDPATLAREHGVRPQFIYTHALNGFAGAISDAARQGLLRDARVQRVEPDGIATIWGSDAITEAGLWGLDRIDDQVNPTLDNNYSYTATGAGVKVYIIDTGILTTHTQFTGRAVSGFDAVDGGTADDCNGHGTHVAGAVGGGNYGVAKSVTLVGVRVLGCGGSGTWSGVIAGIDWVTANHIKPAVANLSLGGSSNSSVDNAVRNMIAAGVATAVAAGNGNIIGIAQDACKYSPARVAEAMTIGATDKTDKKKASWSNYGKCVDWFPPGVGVKSAWYTSTTATNTISGTSMASPHTGGVAALYLQGNTAASAAAVRAALYTNATKSVVTSSKSANNHLLFTNY